MGDDQRPTLAVTWPMPGRNDSLSRILVGMTDAYTGLDLATFTVTADFPTDGVAAGENLASRLRETSPGVWEMRLERPLTALNDATLTVSVKDRQGNIARVARRFWVED